MAEASRPMPCCGDGVGCGEPRWLRFILAACVDPIEPDIADTTAVATSSEAATEPMGPEDDDDAADSESD